MRTERIACFLIANFSIAHLLNTEPSLREQPVVLAEDDLDNSPVIALNDAAATAGLWQGMTVAQAGTLCDNLAVKIRDHTAEIETSNMIFKKLQGLSPFVEEADPGAFFLDASGLTLLYGSEAAYAEQLIDIATRLHYHGQVGIADNRFVASVAAVSSDHDAHRIVPSGSEQIFLQQLELQHLPIERETLETLHDLGVRTIGRLASFPANELTRRFGPEGTALAQLSRGKEEGIAFFERTPDETLTKTEHLLYPIHRRDTICAHVGHLLEPLLTELGRFSKGCTTIEVILTFENRTNDKTTIAVERPTLTPKLFLRQLEQTFERATLDSGVSDITVRIPRADDLLTEQLSLSPGHNKTPDRPIDHGNVFRPHLQPGILPEEYFAFLEAAAQKPKRANNGHPPRPPFAGRDIVGLRLMQPPQPIGVTTEQQHFVHIVPQRQRRRNVTAHLGPWELSGNWWSRPFHRLYYELEATDRQFYLVYYDCLDRTWFLHGIFD